MIAERLTFIFILNNLEGFERRSRKEYLNFLSLGARSLAEETSAGSHRNIAKGSAGELRSLLTVAREVGYLEEKTYLELYNQAKELSRMLASQIKAIKRSLQ